MNEKPIYRGDVCFFHNADGDIRWGNDRLLSEELLKKIPDWCGLIDRLEYFEAKITCPACRSYNEKIRYQFWSKEVVVQFLKKEQKKMDNEYYEKINQQKLETKEPIIDVIERHFQKHDWYYDYSDDGDIWMNGREHWDYICKLFKRAKREGRYEDALELFYKYAPHPLNRRLPMDK